MAIGALSISGGDSIHMEHVCSWECADNNYRRRRIKPMFEDGYELEYSTLCAECGSVIPATITDNE